MYVPSGRGDKESPGLLNPKDRELNILKSLGVKGRETVPNPLGISIVIVGEDIGGLAGYVEISAIPNVNLLNVSITSISKLKSAIIYDFKIKKGREVLSFLPFIRYLILIYY
jgi:hypothetical protein